jgi:hypothetical protein
MTSAQWRRSSSPTPMPLRAAASTSGCATCSGPPVGVRRGPWMGHGSYLFLLAETLIRVAPQATSRMRIQMRDTIKETRALLVLNEASARLL